MIGRLLRRGDFERLLAMRPCSRDTHFAVHYLHAGPGAASRRARADGQELSTAHAPAGGVSVDDRVVGHWLGSVIPKRHAPRAVTRNMLRRQIRAAMQRSEARLPPGLWLVRLRQPFARDAFVSADSAALRASAATELDRMLSRAPSSAPA